MDQAIQYVTIDGEDYLPRSTYEQIGNRMAFYMTRGFGLLNLSLALAIPTFYAGEAHGAGQGLTELVQNLSTGDLVVGSMALLNGISAYCCLSKSKELKKELSD
tara:strand:+ start:3983 stop:4294 length:312 start_codon:yes stop_codon:yes gene_type:complete